MHTFKKLTLLFILINTISYSQTVEIYPPNWWTGMKTNKIQLLLRSTQSDFSTGIFSMNYAGIKLNKTNTFENGKYVALDIEIAENTSPGTVSISYLKGKKKSTFTWLLKAREGKIGVDYAAGVTSSDFIYLLLPDRFSNGNSGNDKVA
ncbi:MAG: cyclomaltodextrinase N-terminal domain-containing protein, partial [Cyclobacteriaceae bacterium]|nr:cyclomaltodextrinase N-terminal domain-containing protein [Cyclobacteriaceae bacterium]